MQRLFPLFLAPLALAATAFLLLPSGQMATAEGCSGSPDALCWATAAASASWAMTSTEVPINAPLQLAVEEASAHCDFAGAA